MIVSLNQLPLIRKEHLNKSIVFAGGVFDVFHTAHVKTLKKLRDYGDIVVIGIVSDKRVQERKGPKRPILKQHERREIVDAIKYVDYVVQMPNSTTLRGRPTLSILEKLRPNVFVSVDKHWLKYQPTIESLGIELRVVKRVASTSSTSIIERIVNRFQPRPTGSAALR